MRAVLALLVATGPALAQAPAAPAPAPPAPAWVPRGTVDLVALDKVNVRTQALTGRVGEVLKFGSLSVVARSCVVRGPDQAADAAAFLDIADSHPGGAPFHAWMVLSQPAASMLEHPVYDIRLAGCRP